MSSKYVIGCDPDSSGNGIAFFIDGKLMELKNLSTIDFYLDFKFLEGEDVTFSVEDTMKKKATFSKRGAVSDAQKRKVAMDVGRCQQAQVEIVRVAEMLGFKIKLRPISSKWKKGPQAEEFKRCTGWKGRSNEDTRSAAWMGYQVL